MTKKPSYRELEERIRAIADTAIDPIFCKDSRRRYTFANRAMAELFQCHPKDLLGKTPDQLFAPESAAIIREIDDRTFSGERVSEIRTLEIHDQPFHFHTVQVPMEVENGQVIAIQGIVRDITDNTTFREQNIKLTSQLRQSQKMEAMGTLAAGIAHDFNNILGIILGNTELAMEEAPVNSSISEYLQEINAASYRVRDLVRQILYFSHKSKPCEELLAPREIVRDSIKFIRSSIPSSVQILSSIEACEGMLRGDPRQIQQVIVNLCTNAAHAMDYEGILQIALKKIAIKADDHEKFGLQPGCYAKLSITDNGSGIEKQNIEKIFDPYFTTKPFGKSSGLGLAVAYGIVQSHNGAIKVTSERDCGSCFTVYLPLSSRMKDRQQMITPSLGGEERILFVDDEKMLVRVIPRMLKSLGYKVEYDHNPLKILEIFRRQPQNFDLIIADMSMPQLTGNKLSLELMKIRPDIPIILCSGYSELMSEEIARQLGIRKYLLKPLSKKVLGQAIREVLNTF